uniref:Secreted protein n=1 Tax=Micrurus corallinus TaxID=54390 RepID=A0A2D4FU97_MICCO
MRNIPAYFLFLFFFLIPVTKLWRSCHGDRPSQPCRRGALDEGHVRRSGRRLEGQADSNFITICHNRGRDEKTVSWKAKRERERDRERREKGHFCVATKEGDPSVWAPWLFSG